MPIALLALLLSAAVQAEETQPLIDRPITLPNGTVDLTLQGTYTNWYSIGGTVDGESLALGVDVGASDRVQVGVALGLPINPGAGFGSVLANVAFAADPKVALRLDGGYERIGFNGDGTGGSDHANRGLVGIGVFVKVPITPNIAFVSGRTGAAQFGHFNNFGISGTGFYSGAGALAQASADLLVMSGGDLDNSIGVHLPLALLLQPDRRLALTLETGYSASISSTQALSFVPLALEVVVTPVPGLDIGARFWIDGYVGGGDNIVLGYFDRRALLFWFRVGA